MRLPDPAPTALDRYFRRIFGDNEPTGLGSGWVGGIASLLGGALGLFGVLCLHYPQLFTAPVLRSYYPVTLLRGVLQTVLIASVSLGLFSVARRRRKVLGLTGIFLGVSAMALGGAAVPHAAEAEAIDKNFAVHLPILDRMFGTQFLPDTRWPRGYGVSDGRVASTYLAQILGPFRGSSSSALE